MRSDLTIEVLWHRRNQYTVIVRSGHKVANGLRNFSTTEMRGSVPDFSASKSQAAKERKYALPVSA
jgi:hypothetical protein